MIKIKILNRTILELFILGIMLMFFIGCAPINPRNPAHIGAAIYDSLIPDEKVKDINRARYELIVEDILEYLEKYKDNKVIIINNIFLNKDWLPDYSEELRRKLRGHIPPGKATDPLTEKAGKLKKIFRCLHREFYLRHAYDVGKFIFKRGGDL